MSRIDQESETLTSLASRTGFSPDAVESMRQSMLRGGGGMAQFDHREFGGLGQWMRGGLLMIADPSDQELKRRIDRLCEALSAGVAGDAATFVEPAPRAAGQWQRQGGSASFDRRVDQPTWYPGSLGTPDSSGSQNDLRYAWFAASRRLAVDRHGVVTLYDTGDHRIGGVAQQQGATHTLSFVSQHGDVDLDRLPVVGDEPSAVAPARAIGRPTPSQPAASSSVDPFVALEKLADLHARGVLDDQEFATKKAELLKRI